MNELLQILITMAQGVALWAIIYRWEFIKHTTERYFLFYLIYIMINEVIAKILTYSDLGNYALYNIYDLVTYSFFLFWFSKIIPYKKVINALLALYVIGLLTSLFIEDPIHSFLNIHVYTGTTIILILVVLYFASLLQQEQIIHYLKTPAFWITTGLLLFHMGYIPIQFLLSFENFDRTGIYAVLSILNILQYGCFTKGFLCNQRK